LLLMVLSGGGIIVQSFVAGWATKRLGERRSVILGMMVNTAGFAGIGLAASVPAFWAAMSLLILAGIAFPNLMSLLSRRVGVDQQGQLQGALAILMGASQLIGPLAYTNVFAWAVRDGAWLHLPGLPMLVGSGLLLIAVGLSIGYARAPEGSDEAPDRTSGDTPGDTPLAHHAG
jgi:DHA1 family tetracycline resistance protein-like MFS transporter